MTIKEIKEEARKKLALNMHQAIVIYTVEFTVFITLVALVVMSCVCLGVNTVAAIVMICYGCLLGLIAFVACGMVNFAMVDFYLAAYRCKPYNVRRLGDTLARSNITKIFLISLKRTLLSFLLLLCLIVPGVIYMIRTSMAYYLLIANPKMKSSTALSASNKVMSGKTGAYFSLCMSMFGWYLLGVLTLGLGFIFIAPYTNLIKAVYYKRNLQGDKTVYAVEVQPVSLPNAAQPPYAGVNAVPQNNAVSTPQAQQAAPSAANSVQPNGNNNARPEAVTPIIITPPPAPAPIDTLDADDVNDLNDAMRDFGAKDENLVQQQTVPEVPIAPPKKAKDEPVTVVPQAVEPEEKKAPVSKSVEGSNLVETERTLTADELNASAAAKEQAIANMYSHSGPQSSPVNYFAETQKQHPNDFVTREVDTDIAGSTPTVEVIGADSPDKTDADDFVMSDSEFEEFLRGFDSMPKQSPEFPLKRSANANNNNGAATPSHDPAYRTARASAVNDRPSDRAERIRLERERKNLINNKK